MCVRARNGNPQDSTQVVAAILRPLRLQPKVAIRQDKVYMLVDMLDLSQAEVTILSS